MPNLPKKGKKNIYRILDLYNNIVIKNKDLNPVFDLDKKDVQNSDPVGQNKSMNELFNQAKDKAIAMSDLLKLYL